MKRFLTTTAVTLVLGTAAFAEAHSNAFMDLKYDSAANVNASEVVGARVYITENDMSGVTSVATDGEKEWDDIGEINEIVLSRDGTVLSVIVGVGGFLGIGEKDVAIDMKQLKFVSDGEAADEYFLVVNSNLAGVENAPAYVRADTTTEQTAGIVDRQKLTAPDVARDGYETVASADLTTEDLTGARVYGMNDEDVGEISELIVTDDGKLDLAVIDVGGFLGIGERPVALTFDELQIVRGDGNSFRVYIDSTKEALEAQPEYEG